MPSRRRRRGRASTSYRGAVGEARRRSTQCNTTTGLTSLLGGRADCAQIVLNEGRRGTAATYMPLEIWLNFLRFLVGARGFEPPTPRSRTECSTRLSHAPTLCSLRGRAPDRLSSSPRSAGACPAPRGVNRYLTLVPG